MFITEINIVLTNTIEQISYTIDIEIGYIIDIIIGSLNLKVCSKKYTIKK